MAAGKSVETYQDMYQSNAKLAYNLSRTEDKNRVLMYMQKNQKKGHENFIWYKSGRLSAQDQEDNYNATDFNYSDMKGTDMTDFLSAVRGTPTPIDLPIYLKKDEFDKTMLDIAGNIPTTQVSGINQKCMQKILTPIHEYTRLGTYVQPKKDGTATAITIPAGQVFGDDTKDFYANEEAFFDMLSKMEEFSTGAAGDFTVSMFFGTKANGHLNNYDRTNNKDYITSSDYESKDGKKYAVKRFNIAEMCNIREFDGVFGTTLGTIVGVIKDAVGYDTRGEMDSESDYKTEKRAYFYNSTIHDKAEIVDQEGVFVFKYDGTLGARVYNTTP